MHRGCGSERGGHGVFTREVTVDLLKVESVEAGIGLIQVLWGTSIIVEENQCVVLLGVNGAGKTTLLKTIIGLVKARKGESSLMEKK